MKKTVIGILAHVDAGKTTLAEAMLYKTGKLRRPGRVDTATPCSTATCSSVQGG